MGDDLLQVLEGSCDARLMGSPGDIGIEEIFERRAGIGARLDLQKVDLAKGEDTEDMKEDPRPVHRGREHDAAASSSPGRAPDIGVPGPPRRARHDKKTREIVPAVLDIPPENLETVEACRVLAGNRTDIPTVPVRERFCRPRGVEVWLRHEGPVSAEEFAALREGLGVRTDRGQPAETGPGVAHEDMFDPQMRLSDNMEAVVEEEVIVLVNASRQRVLDRYHAPVGAAAFDLFEHPLKRRAGYRRDASAEYFPRGQFAVGAMDSLECSLHRLLCPDNSSHGWEKR